MINTRFVVSCIASSIVMFIASYLWHGVFLNDLSKISYPLHLFFIFSAIAYIVISLFVVMTNKLRIVRYNNNMVLEGFLSGAICGFFIYIVSIVIGVSFSKNLILKNILFDVCWQMLEQGIGGTIVGLVSFFYPLFQPHNEPASS